VSRKSSEFEVVCTETVKVRNEKLLAMPDGLARGFVLELEVGTDHKQCALCEVQLSSQGFR